MTKIEKEIARRNKIWKNASKSQKQVLVAKDVLQRLRAKKFQAKPQIWATISNTTSDSVQECLLSDTSTCQGCAMGGLMMGLVSYQNKVTVQDMTPSDEGYSISRRVFDSEVFSLNKIFTESQQRLIELAFEHGAGKYKFFWFDTRLNTLWFNDDLPGIQNALKRKNLNIQDRQNLRIMEFYLSNPNPDVRLRKIMQNIVDHNGRFVI